MYNPTMFNRLRNLLLPMLMLLFVVSSHAQSMENLPAPEEVVKDVHGSNEFDTKIKQSAMLTLMSNLMIELSNNNLTMKERDILSTYIRFDSRLSNETTEMMRTQYGNNTDAFAAAYKKRDDDMVAMVGNATLKQQLKDKYFAGVTQRAAPQQEVNNYVEQPINEKYSYDNLSQHDKWYVGRQTLFSFSALLGWAAVGFMVFIIMLIMKATTSASNLYRFKKWDAETQTGVVVIGNITQDIKAETGMVQDLQAINKGVVSNNYVVSNTLTEKLFIKLKDGQDRSYPFYNTNLECTYGQLVTVYSLKKAGQDWWAMMVDNVNTGKRFSNGQFLYGNYSISAGLKALYFLCWILLLALIIVPQLYFPELRSRIGIGSPENGEYVNYLRELSSSYRSGIRTFGALGALFLIYVGGSFTFARKSRIRKFKETFALPK